MPRKTISPEERLRRFSEKRALLPEQPKELKLQIGPAGKAEAIIELINSAYTETMAINRIQCFVLYDIEDNKVRKYISDFLERMGLVRIQKSVFFGNLKNRVYDEVCSALSDVNKLYQNDDSLMVVPVFRENVRGMKVIGKEVDFHYIADKPVVVFL